MVGLTKFSHRRHRENKRQWIVQNHAARVAIYALRYNFARIHKTLRITPAMACGLSDQVWSLEEIVMMADRYMPKPGPRGPYKKKGAV
jgi:hypothetical protein